MAMTLIVRPRRLREIVAATLAKLEGRISQDELERVARSGEQMGLGIGAVTETPTRGQGDGVTVRRLK